MISQIVVMILSTHDLSFHEIILALYHNGDANKDSVPWNTFCHINNSRDLTVSFQRVF